jgi:hypothetical protein
LILKAMDPIYYNNTVLIINHPSCISNEHPTVAAKALGQFRISRNILHEINKPEIYSFSPRLGQVAFSRGLGSR